MPRLLLLALSLFCLTLVVPAWVWCMSTSWRLAWQAWKGYAAWMGALYTVGVLVWLGIWLGS